MIHKPYLYFALWQGPRGVCYADVSDGRGADVTQVSGKTLREARATAKAAIEDRGAIAKSRELKGV